MNINMISFWLLVCESCLALPYAEGGTSCQLAENDGQPLREKGCGESPGSRREL